MPVTRHVERHFTSGETVRDIVIGMSDGLTVPFALAAGLSGAVESTSIVITAGLAEIAAGSIAMGLGGYLAPGATHRLDDAERAAAYDGARACGPRCWCTSGHESIALVAGRADCGRTGIGQRCRQGRGCRRSPRLVARLVPAAEIEIPAASRIEPTRLRM
jgi:VIT1/CCC1 family predicted Fe2+/Mn2+ transporter